MGENFVKVCYIYQDQYPWDIRVEKITETLAKNGVETHILSRNRDGLPRQMDVKKNLYIKRLPYVGGRHINNFINMPAFFSPFWLYSIKTLISTEGIDLMIVRDLPLAPAAWLVGRYMNIPVIMDMAENYPAMIADTWTFRGPNLIDYLIRNPILLRKLEKVILPKFDSVWVVSSYSANRLIKLGVSRDKIRVVGNTPDVGKSSILHTDIVEYYRKISNFILLYVGGLEETRGLKTVILALPKLIKVIPEIVFLVVGKGTSEEMLRSLVSELEIEKHVQFVGWKDQSEIPSIIFASDVCIVPHYITDHTDTTIPNKIYDYMAQKKPVIVTNAKSMTDIIEDNGCGVTYNDNNIDQFVESVLKMNNYETRTKYGENGYNAIQNKYNWNIDSYNLLESIRECLNRGK